MTSDFRSYIRSQINPFPRVATYLTSWAGSLTFQQIYDDLAHYVTNVMKGKGIHRTNYLPDCIQHGFMALWLELSANKDFLAQKTRQQAVFLLRCGECYADVGWEDKRNARYLLRSHLHIGESHGVFVPRGPRINRFPVCGICVPSMS
jgi:hypothetical protein